MPLAVCLRCFYFCEDHIYIRKMNKRLLERKTELISIEQLRGNEGQILGLPKNPRTWTEDATDKLKKSIESDPEFLNYKPLLVYPYIDESNERKYCVIGGNFRLEVCKEMGYKELTCMVLPEDTEAEKLRSYTIKDNNEFGTWDWTLIDLEWSDFPLQDWGLDGMKEWSDLPYIEDDIEDPSLTKAPVISIKVNEADEHEKILMLVKASLEGYNVEIS